MALLTPFDFQEEGILKCLDYLRSDDKRPLVFVGPVAAGKSLIISDVARRWGKPTLVLQPSAELLKQNLEKLRMLGGDAAVFSASAGSKELDKFTYATLGSVKTQVEYLKKMGVETVLIDEAHYGYSPEPDSQFMKFIKLLKPKKVIGFTATPFRLKTVMEGAQLNMLNRMRPGYFRGFVHIIQVPDIIKRGRWSKLVYETYRFIEDNLDLNSSGSEFSEESVRESIRVQGINNSIYLKAKKLVLEEGRNSVLIFMDAIENCEVMVKALNKVGVKAAYLSGGTPKKEREKIIKDFKSGNIKVICNHSILTTGFDYPELSAVILGRPTASLALYYQKVGRGARVHETKRDCLIIDYCNNVKRFGKVENLLVENYDGWGWCMTNGDRILTNYPMGNKSITKYEVDNKLVSSTGLRTEGMKMTFGKYKGEIIENIPITYLKWVLKEVPLLEYNNGHTYYNAIANVIADNGGFIEETT